jgi:hypothetical protein
MSQSTQSESAGADPAATLPSSNAPTETDSSADVVMQAVSASLPSSLSSLPSAASQSQSSFQLFTDLDPPTLSDDDDDQKQSQTLPLPLPSVPPASASVKASGPSQDADDDESVVGKKRLRKPIQDDDDSDSPQSPRAPAIHVGQRPVADGPEMQASQDSSASQESQDSSTSQETKDSRASQDSSAEFVQEDVKPLASDIIIVPFAGVFPPADPAVDPRAAKAHEFWRGIQTAEWTLDPLLQSGITMVMQSTVTAIELELGRALEKEDPDGDFIKSLAPEAGGTRPYARSVLLLARFRRILRSLSLAIGPVQKAVRTGIDDPPDEEGEDIENSPKTKRKKKKKTGKAAASAATQGQKGAKPVTVPKQWPPHYAISVEVAVPFVKSKPSLAGLVEAWMEDPVQAEAILLEANRRYQKLLADLPAELKISEDESAQHEEATDADMEAAGKERIKHLIDLLDESKEVKAAFGEIEFFMQSHEPLKIPNVSSRIEDDENKLQQAAFKRIKSDMSRITATWKLKAIPKNLNGCPFTGLELLLLDKTHELIVGHRKKSFIIIPSIGVSSSRQGPWHHLAFRPITKELRPPVDVKGVQFAWISVDSHDPDETWYELARRMHRVAEDRQTSVEKTILEATTPFICQRRPWARSQLLLASYRVRVGELSTHYDEVFGQLWGEVQDLARKDLAIRTKYFNWIDYLGPTELMEVNKALWPPKVSWSLFSPKNALANICSGPCTVGRAHLHHRLRRDKRTFQRIHLRLRRIGRQQGRPRPNQGRPRLCAQDSR